MANAQALDDGDRIVTDCNGQVHRVSKIDWEIAIEGTPVSSFPAQPGTYLINPADEAEDGRKYWRENVVGWMICADTILRPVVLGPESLLTPPWQVLHPDGRVERSDGSTWETVDEWLEEVRLISERAR
jgi:hypothetical protein